MSQIYLPGRGMTDLRLRRVDAAVKEYDERLYAGRNVETGYDTVFVKMPLGEDDIPILAFPSGFPDKEHLFARLYACDAKRRGSRILDELRKHNDKLHEPLRRQADDQAGQVAEIAESAMHRLGNTRYHRSLAKRDPKQRVSS